MQIANSYLHSISIKFCITPNIVSLQTREKEKERKKRVWIKDNKRHKSYDFSGPHIGRSWNRKFDNEFGEDTMELENYLHFKLSSAFHGGLISCIRTTF